MFDKYDGKTDPFEHLAYFRSTVALYQYDDATLCKLFSSSLKGSVRTWYSMLRARSIGDFKELSRQFHLAFMSNQKAEVDTNSLVRIRQGRNKSLKDYWKRFNGKMIQIPMLDQSVAFAALKNEITDDRLIYGIRKDRSRVFTSSSPESGLASRQKRLPRR